MLHSASFLKFLDIWKGPTRRALHLLEVHQVRWIVVELGVDQHRFADRAVTNGLPYGADRVAVEVVGRAREHPSASLSEREQLPGLVEVGRQRLLGVDVLAGFERAFHD